MFWCCLSSVCQTAPAEALCVCVCHCAHVKGELWDCCLHGCYCEACCSVMEMRQLLCTSAAVSASAVSREIFFLNQQCRHLLCFYVLSVPWLCFLNDLPFCFSLCTVCVLRWGLLCLRARQDYCLSHAILTYRTGWSHKCRVDPSFPALCYNVGTVIRLLCTLKKHWCRVHFETVFTQNVLVNFTNNYKEMSRKILN